MATALSRTALVPDLGTVQVEQRDGVALIRLLGEHDMATVETLRRHIERAIVADRGLVVSLTETELIDSSVTHALLEGDTMLRARGRRLVLHVATDSMVRRVLETFQLSTALPTTASLDEAITLANARVDA